LKCSARVSAFSLFDLAHVLLFLFKGVLCIVEFVNYLVAFHRVIRYRGEDVYVVYSFF